MAKRTKSRSDAQQKAEQEMLRSFAARKRLAWCEAGGIAALRGLGVKPDGVALRRNGTIVLAEVWAHQGRAKGSQLHKVAADILKLAYVKRALEQAGCTVEAFMLFSCRLACNTLNNSSWRARAAAEFGVSPRVVEILPETRKALVEAQEHQNFYVPE